MEALPESQGTQVATQLATQQATQPYLDPRRLGQEWIGVTEEEASDIICVIHANTDTAVQIIETTMLRSPEHMLQNDDLDNITQADLIIAPDLSPHLRRIALRMSATTKSPREGFKFGRNPETCDILLTPDRHNRLISNVHFRIFVNDQGSLMMEDMSTNGTSLDEIPIKTKDKYGNQTNISNLRVLKHGSIISFMPTPDRIPVKIMVRLPMRTQHEQAYDRNLRHYLRARGEAPKFASIREHSFGNYWNGGDTYNITGILGKGAFATVYRLQHKFDGYIIAAKEIDSRKFAKNGDRDVKLDNELRIMSALRHPNIVEFMGHEKHDHFIYLFMEHVPYGDLAGELQLLDFLPEWDVQTITFQTLHALDYMHRKGITHRDIKPDNILVAQRAPLIVKLSDFGLSKSVVDKNTFLRTFCGTLLYCAPEVYPEYNCYINPPFKRRRPGDRAPIPDTPYDSSADMWSFGAVLFHLLAGEGPIPAQGGTNGQAMLETIMTQEIDYEPVRRKGIAEAGIDFIQSLLNRQPGLRPKETECFKHRWLRDVPIMFDYSEFKAMPPLVPRNTRLPTVDEDDEDDIDDGEGQILQVSPNQMGAEHENARPTKKPRMLRAETGIPKEIMYPYLESTSQADDSRKQQSGGPKLFGEMTASVLKSSGLFGMGNGAWTTVDAGDEYQKNDMPQISSQMERVEIEDLSKTPGNTESATPKVLNDIENRDFALQVPQPQAKHLGSVSSLSGAEKQLQDMHMMATRSEAVMQGESKENQPLSAFQKGVFLESPSPSLTESMSLSVRTKSNGLVRRVNMDLVKDENAFADERKRRESIREENARTKAQTFNGFQGQIESLVKSSVARDFADYGASDRPPTQPDNKVQRNTIHVHTPDEPAPVDAVTDDDPHLLPDIDVDISTVTNFGKLVPLEGSISDRPIPLNDRTTIWGRAPACQAQYENVKDTRIPKFGMKIIFHAPGIEELEEKGDWRLAPGIRTIIATSARKGIWINDSHLSRETEDGKAALYGKLYTGDVVTIVNPDIAGAFLKYKVEIVFGDSARSRPEDEIPFRTQTETAYHARMKERTGAGATASFGESLASSPPVLS